MKQLGIVRSATFLLSKPFVNLSAVQRIQLFPGEVCDCVLPSNVGDMSHQIRILLLESMKSKMTPEQTFSSHAPVLASH